MSGAVKLAQGLAWLVSGRLAGALLSIASTAVLARILTPADFGVVAAAMVVLSLANVVFDGAFGINLLRKKELRPQDIRTTLTMGLVLSLALLAAVVYLAPDAERFFGIAGVGLVLAASSVTIPFKAIFAIATAKLQRDHRFELIAGASLAGQFAGYILVGIPLALFGMRVWALVIAMIVAGAAEAAVMAYLAKLSFRPSWDMEAVKDIGGASLFSVANVMNWAANTGANAIVGRYMGAADLGYYSRGWKLLDLLVGATATPLSKVLMPAFARHFGDDKRLGQSFLSVLGIVLPLYAVASALLTLQTPLIVAVTLGHQWDATIPVAQILFATLLPRCAFKVSENFAIALGKSAAAALRQALYAAMMIGGAFVGLSYGVVGVALGISAAITVFYIASMSYAVSAGKVRKGAVVGLHLRAVLLAALVALADLSVLILLSELPLWVQHAAAGSTGVFVAVALLVIAPKFWIGVANLKSLKVAFESLRSRFLPGGMSRMGSGY